MKKDDFESWLAHPVTEEFFKAIREQVIETTRNNWNSVSWGSEALWRDGRAQEMRAVCKARVDCAEDILSIRLEEEEDDEQIGDSSHGVQGSD